MLSPLYDEYSLQSMCYLGACTREEDEVNVDVMDRQTGWVPDEHL